MIEKQCVTCGGSDFLRLTTYKRFWHFCRQCGTAVSEQRSKYPLRFLPFPDYKKSSEVDEEKMYDYFVDPVHIDWSTREGREFIDQYLRPHSIEVAGKSILDISGGNGHAVKQLEHAGALVALTEINNKAIEYALATHGFPVFEYNLNEHDLASVTGCTYDIVLARACIMFARNLPSFVDQLRRCLNPGGLVVIHRSVKPTLGVMTRVQLDEFSYFVLRQPATIIDAFAERGFALDARIDETDPTLYVYDNDLRPHWMFAHYIYEIRATRRLGRERLFELPARDRRLNTLFFRVKG